MHTEAAPARQRRADSHEIRPLTGVRGFAAAVVVISHFYGYWAPLLPRLGIIAPIASRGPSGVDLFFMLSGFILCYVYGAGESKYGWAEFKRFIWFRMARIFPNHIFVLMVLAALVGYSEFRHLPITGDYPWAGLPFHFLLLQRWPFINAGAWNYPAWSLSVEWFAYIFVFPIAWMLLKLRPPAVVFCGLAYGLLTLLLIAPPNWPLGPTTQVACEFLCGACLFGAFRNSKKLVPFCRRSGTVFFAVLLGILQGFPPFSPRAWTCTVLVLPLFLLSLTGETSLSSKFFSLPVSLWLGRISYALYICHAVVLKFVKIALPVNRYAARTEPVKVAICLGSLLVTTAAAAAIHYWVEIPSRDGLRKLQMRFSIGKERAA